MIDLPFSTLRADIVSVFSNDNVSRSTSTQYWIETQTEVVSLVHGKMVPWLRAYAALPEDWGSNPSTHTVANGHL